MATIIKSKYEFNWNTRFKNSIDHILREAIPNKWDFILIIHGKEGSGKSSLATQICCYMDQDFDIHKTVFLAEDFIETCQTCPPESAILWDEAITGANVMQHASQVSQAVIRMLTQIRKKRLKIILCFPYLYMLNKYFVLRCTGSIYIYAKTFSDRGHSIVFNQSQTEKLYNLQKERFKYSPVQAINSSEKSFYMKFGSTFCLPIGEYDKKKEDSIMRVTEAEDKKEDFILKRRLAYLCIYLHKIYGMTYKDIAEKLKIQYQTLNLFLSGHRDINGEILTKQEEYNKIKEEESLEIERKKARLDTWIKEQQALGNM